MKQQSFVYIYISQEDIFMTVHQADILEQYPPDYIEKKGFCSSRKNF